MKMLPAALGSRLRAAGVAELLTRGARAVAMLVVDYTRAYLVRPPTAASSGPIGRRLGVDRTSLGPFRTKSVEQPVPVSDFLRNPLTGQRSPGRFATLIRRQQSGRYGDIHFLAEPSRFATLPLQAARTVRERERTMIIAEMTRWIRQNPYCRTVHWTSGIEVAIRALNWTATLACLETDSPIGAEPRKLILSSLRRHFQYLAGHRSTFSSANNHYVAEIVALAVLAHVLELRHARRWQARSRRWISREVMRQTDRDGYSRERAVRYHDEVTQLVLVGVASFRRAGKEFEPHVLQRLRQMVGFSRWIHAGPGFGTRLGDSDDGYPVAQCPAGLANSVSALGTLLGLQGAVRPDLASVIFAGGIEDPRGRPTVSQSGTVQSTDSVDGVDGYRSSAGIMRAQRGAWTVVFDAGDLGLPPLFAHGHADLLSVQIWYRREPVAIDAGTGSYHRDQLQWRYYFRSTRAHNCVALGEHDQSVQLGRMQWDQGASCVVDAARFSPSEAYFSARFVGFDRYGIPLVHRRRVSVNEERVAVHDAFLPAVAVDSEAGSNQPEADATGTLFWHLSPDVSTRIDEPAVVSCRTRSGMLLDIALDPRLSVRIARGERNPKLGWYSPQYGSIVPSDTVVAELTATRGVEYRTIICNRSNGETTSTRSLR